MSSQFSYELDERQIRIMMQDAESEYNEAMWQKFDSLANSESKASVDISSYIPKLNLSISRSIIVPVLFVILIGGLSAALFSFVDFKKKEAIDKEIPLVANPENIKKPQIVTKNFSKPIEKKEVKIVENNIVTPPSDTISNDTVTLPTVEAKKDVPVNVTETKSKETSTTPVITKKETVHAPEGKKKKRKIKAEILPTINATTNLNEGVSEPELDLK